jgi:hypothetical protein
MNRLDKAAYDRMVRGLSEISGICRALAEIKIPRIVAACPDEELPRWVKDAKESGRALIEFGAALANRSGSGIPADEEATSAARYLGSKGGRAGGAKGGEARMGALTVEQRRELGRKAAAARWGKPAAAGAKVRGKAAKPKG